MYPDLPRLALSIRQPWVWAILNLDKRIENRTWSTKIRGPICLHAAKGMKDSEFQDFIDFLDDIRPLPSDLEMRRRKTRILGELTPRGGIVATAELVDCGNHFAGDDWFHGPYGFKLANIQPVPFIKVRGLQQFFDWRAQLGGGAS